MKTVRLKPFTCPRCCYEMYLATGSCKDARPVPGDISLCSNCGAINIFTPELQIRRATATEEKKTLASKIGSKVLWAQAEIRKRGRIPRVKDMG